jgi:hypothetical protein
MVKNGTGRKGKNTSDPILWQLEGGLWVFLPLFCGRSHHVSPFTFSCFFLCADNMNSPRRLSGERPQLGDGPWKLALGDPPGGCPGADPSSWTSYLGKEHEKGPWGGPGGAPGGGPGGVSVGPRGPLGGSGGPSRGGTPRGAPRWPPSQRTILPFWSRPPGGPPGGPFVWGAVSRGAK